MKARRIAPGVWRVEGDSGNEYTVFYNPRLHSWVCTCPDYVHRLRTCKHIIFLLSQLSHASAEAGAGKGGGR